jgi:hypothetical protein
MTDVSLVAVVAAAFALTLAVAATAALLLTYRRLSK